MNVTLPYALVLLLVLGGCAGAGRRVVQAPEAPPAAQPEVPVRARASLELSGGFSVGWVDVEVSRPTPHAEAACHGVIREELRVREDLELRPLHPCTPGALPAPVLEEGAALLVHRRTLTAVNPEYLGLDASLDPEALGEISITSFVRFPSLQRCLDELNAYREHTHHEVPRPLVRSEDWMNSQLSEEQQHWSELTGAVWSMKNRCENVGYGEDPDALAKQVAAACRGETPAACQRETGRGIIRMQCEGALAELEEQLAATEAKVKALVRRLELAEDNDEAPPPPAECSPPAPGWRDRTP